MKQKFDVFKIEKKITKSDFYFKNEKFFDFLKNNYDAYIFGGVIKDFVLGSEESHRDIDIVINKIDDDFVNYLSTYQFQRNQFGGIKLFINETIFDIWDYNETWALKKYPIMKFEKVPYHLPYTTFFNSTAVLFSISKHELIYSSLFIDFIKSNILKIVFEDNPFPELCIIKTYEYYKKFNVKLSKELKSYWIRNFHSNKGKLHAIQIKHYGSIIYSLDELYDFYDKILDDIQFKNNRRKQQRNYSMSNQLELFKV